MVLDLIFLGGVLLFLIVGYNKGLVSMVLNLGLMILSFVAAVYTSLEYPILVVPVAGNWPQAIITFVILAAISRQIVSLIDFEEIMVVGLLSKILGGLLYAVIFTAIAALILGAGVYLAPEMMQQNFADSYVLKYVHELLGKLSELSFTIPQL